MNNIDLVKLASVHDFTSTHTLAPLNDNGHLSSTIVKCLNYNINFCTSCKTLVGVSYNGSQLNLVQNKRFTRNRQDM
jgi:hypothetical protein